jgi:precorrin-6A/cobalt-precorrin-6A reductase
VILLLGGTTETAIVAQALAEAGCRVLVSTATDIPLAVGTHASIRLRQGRMDEDAMAALIVREQITALVDVTHPYATEVRATAARVANRTGIKYFTFVRPTACGSDGGDVITAPDHATAARLACEFRKPVLLTIGSRHVAEYVQPALAAGVPLIARVLPHEESLAACREAGLSDDHVITGRGPFTLEENRDLIRRFSIGVLVTKDSGDAGGFQAKLEAARLEACRFIVVGRTPVAAPNAFDQIEPLIQAVEQFEQKFTKTAKDGENT